MTGLCDCYKLICKQSHPNPNIISVPYMVQDTTQNNKEYLGFFCFLYKPIFFCYYSRNMVKILPARGILQLVFYPSLGEVLRSMLQTNSMPQHNCFFTSMKLDTSNVFEPPQNFCLDVLKN